MHQALVIGDVDFRQQHRPQRLARPDKVMQVGARITARRWPRALFVERPWIVSMSGVAQIDLAEPRIRHPVTAVARRHHAIEHVDAARDGLQNIFGRADTHQIPWTPLGQDRDDLIDRRKHHRLRFADREAPDRVAVKADLDQASRAGPAQLRDVAALRDAEQHVSSRRGLEGAPAALSPAQ